VFVILEIQRLVGTPLITVEHGSNRCCSTSFLGRAERSRAHTKSVCSESERRAQVSVPEPPSTQIEYGSLGELWSLADGGHGVGVGASKFVSEKKLRGRTSPHCTAKKPSSRKHRGGVAEGVQGAPAALALHDVGAAAVTPQFLSEAVQAGVWPRRKHSWRRETRGLFGYWGGRGVCIHPRRR